MRPIFKTKTVHTVEIDRVRYDELIRKEDFLDALEANGVDNWEYYDEAREDAKNAN